MESYMIFAKNNLWMIVILCVACSATADTVSKSIMEGKDAWLLKVIMVACAISTYIFFGTVASVKGLSVASSVTNGLVVIVPIIIGLVFLQEWKKISWWELAGMVVVVMGILLIAFGGNKHDPPNEAQLPPAEVRQG